MDSWIVCYNFQHTIHSFMYVVIT